MSSSNSISHLILMFKKLNGLIVFLFSVADCLATCNPNDFVFLSDIDAGIIQEIRYYTAHNFMGRRVEGYNTPECVLTRSAAEKLAEVQKLALSQGYTLKVYDCYRPQRAVDDFVAWSNNTMDLLMKTEFYPTIDKPDLFPDYIATKSGHSRGSTVDLTIVQTPPSVQEVYSPGQPLVECFASTEERFGDNSIDMGTGFDCLSEWANTGSSLISDRQHANRMMLVDLMATGGFINYSGEWWHFTLSAEPFPNTYFDFPIQRDCV